MELKIDNVLLSNVDLSDEEKTLYHHGILGQKWGVRRYQNKDGSLTNAGKLRYNEEIKTTGKKNSDGSYRTKRVFTKKDPSKMTDEELGAKPGHEFTAKERLAAEKSYRELMNKTDNDAADLASYKSLTNDAQNAINSSKVFARSDTVRNRYNNRKLLTQEEMDAMDSKDLQALVQRMNLEQQYSNLTADKVEPTIKERVSTGMEYASAALGITGAALGVAASIYAIKNRQKGL